MSEVERRLPDRAGVTDRLERVRERTLALIAVLDWETLRRQHLEILSPMVWDLGHIGSFEDLWLVQELAGRGPLEKTYERMFDATLNPRAERVDLPLPVGGVLFSYLDRVRRRAVEILADARFGDDLRDDLLASGLVYELVAEHEEQHQETLLQAMQALASPPYTPALRRPLPVPRAIDRHEMVVVPDGPFSMGATSGGFAYDNERPAHRVEVGEFRIDRFPVTQGDYLGFVEDGGYDDRRHWSAAGWSWRRQTGAAAPRNWRRHEGRWLARHMDQDLPLRLEAPVVHVSYWEAEAFAAFAGKRLPTEAEWEKAALWCPQENRSRLFPWGDELPTPERANVDQLGFEPAPVGAYPRGASALGVEQMIGDVWEWTASDFRPYPGFRAFPYAEYSEIFFGADYKVLRGGSWATRPAVARGTFRNWDYPQRRQIFAGFRCAA